MRILVVEDDALIRDVIKRGLEDDRIYAVETAEDGHEGLRMALEADYAVIILDIMLPGLDGWQICEELRRRRVSTPILMLTARDAVQDRVRGLTLGADDYLAKPFHFEELLARIQALHRRDSRYKAHKLRIAHLEIDTATHAVTCDGEELILTPREYMLLEALAMNEGRVLSRDAIQYRIWNSEESTSNTVDVYIGMLRKKIDADRPTKLIHTIHGQGYMLRGPHEEVCA
ncbi:MAG TPA: response regulator transcription factor [Armatimonadota bacterium]|jgi:two-component system copper resistance phosphate regulon response regulator CusR